MSGPQERGSHPQAGQRFEDSVVILEVVRGCTRYPLRAVTPEEFLIGSSPVCDLRLTDDAPEFHSFVSTDEMGCHIVVTQSELPLFVNGVAVDRWRLQAGDRLQIGPVELLVHPGEMAEAVGLRAPSRTPLSLEQLVDAIETDLSIVSEFEEDEELAEIDSLLAALHEVAVRESIRSARRWPGSSPYKRICLDPEQDSDATDSDEGDGSAAIDSGRHAA